MSSLAKVDSIDLANYVLAKVKNVKHLKLHKLLYYIEAWHLAYFKESLVRDDFEAWLHGPVSRKVFSEFKNRSRVYDVVPPDRDACRIAKKKIERTLDEEQLELVEDVLREYGPKTAYYLETLTHSELPWIDARKGVHPGSASTNKISKNLMKRFYAAKLDG